MKQRLLLIGIIVCLCGIVGWFAFQGTSKVGDIGSLPGVYEGEATLVLSDQLKKMAANIQVNGQQAVIPDGPMPCKVELKMNEQNEMVMELVDFKMPMEGMTLPFAVCTVTQKEGEEGFFVDGQGTIDYGGKKFNFSHQGKVLDDEFNIELKLVIIPFIAEPKVVFKGKRV